MARKALWQPEFTERVKNLCLLGATDAQMAECLGVSLPTLKRWKASQPGFADALLSGKRMADGKVAKSLYQRAVGFSQQEVDIRVVGGKVVETIYTKRYAPDTTACIFWLKNRQPELWNNRTNADASPIDQVLKEYEAKLRALEVERAQFILDKMRAAETDVGEVDDQIEFLQRLSEMVPN